MPYSTKDTYVFSTFKIVADIEGIGEVRDIVAISGTFALNSIPKASLVMACGINATTNKPATAHRVLQNVKMRAKVKVTLEVQTTDGKESKSPSQNIVVFEGYYAGFGFQRAQDNAQYTLHLVHWLDDLNEGSMLSRNFFPGAGYSLAENANSWSIQAGQGGSGIVCAVPRLDPRNQYIQYGKYTSDFWAETIKPILMTIADWPRPDDACKPPGEAGTEDTIKKALERMPGPQYGNPRPGKLPLNFDDLKEPLNPAKLNKAIEASLSQSGLAGFNYSTFWSMLIGVWAPNFFFAISPGVQWANVIPYFGGLRFQEGGSGFKTIEADEYGYANFMCNTGTILEAINVFWGQSSSSGIIAGDVKLISKTSFCQPAGSFPPLDMRDHRGTILVKEPPGWVTEYVGFAAYSQGSSGLVGRYTGGAMETPDSGNPTPEGGKPDRPEAHRQIKQSRLLDVFAEQWYKTEFLQQRYGEFSGKLRFDIAPGSIVKIKAPTRTMPMLPDNTDMVGMVAQVSFVINAELAQAGTSFSLTNIRSVKEDGEELKTAPLPPFYKKPWPGGPLSLPMAE
ncbi:hypothetical protein EBZ39_00240 [bacterium]|nr:hypothetical protein [bacterium]